MARNGSGTYVLPVGNPVTTGTTISSTWANNTLSDIASALTGSLSYDGQTTPIANLPMGGFAHTGVANATVRTMYASAGQVQDGTLTLLTSVAGTNAITAVGAVGMTAYATGQEFTFVAAGANTTACTLNINAIGAKSIVHTDGTALVSGDIASGAAVKVFYDGTNFQLLSDSNGLSETVSNLTVTSLTSGRVTFAGTGGLLSDNANLYWDNTNARLGIGTTSPATKLDVSGSASNASLGINIRNTSGTGQANSLISFGNDTAVNTAYIWQGASSYTSFGGANSLTIHNSLAAPITFNTNATERMRIDSSGNVGIGTTAPATKLDVSGGDLFLSTNATYIRSKTTGGTSIRMLGINASDVAYVGPIDAGPVSVNFNASSTSTIASFYTSGTEKMRLDASGNLGLGVTPSAWDATRKAFQIGTTGFSFIDGSNNFGVGNNAYYNGTNWIYKTTAFATLYFQSAAGVQSWNIAPSGTAGNPITFTQAMTLDPSGNLSVTGTTTSSSFIPTSSTAPSNGMYLASTNAVGFATNSTRAVYIDNGQNFGIGPVNPTQRLSITGTAGSVATYGSIGDNQERFIWGYAHTTGVNTTSSSAQSLMDSSGNLLLASRASTSSNLIFYTSSATTATERMRIDSSGNVLVTSTGGLGYGTGSGGAVTQITSRTTGVTLNKTNGAITLFSAAGSATAATFTVTNSTVAATDTIIVNQKSGTNLYVTIVTAVAAGSFNITFFTTGGTATDAPVFNYAVIKAVTA